MKCYVGMDIGAVSLTAAMLIEGGAPTPPAGQFTPAGTVGNYSLYVSRYQRTHGQPVETATKALEQAIAAVGEADIAGVCVTGSAGALVAEKLSAKLLNEFKAVAMGLSGMGIKARTVFEIGGQSSKYLLLEEQGKQDAGKMPATHTGQTPATHTGQTPATLTGQTPVTHTGETPVTHTGQTPVTLTGETPVPLHYSISDYSTNGDCAAGTGSFIDQQAGRLKYPVEEVGRLATEARRTAQVAGRCSVFAKSDMIHAQQKGYSPAEVLAGLCNAVARNFRMAVVRSHKVEAPVVLIGGLAANAAVVRGLREAFELGEGQLGVPEHFTHVSAVGAALEAARAAGAGYDMAARMAQLHQASDRAGGAFPTAPPLNMDRVVLLRDRVEAYQMPFGQEKVQAYLGVDIGSVSTNVVLIDTEGNLIKDIYVRTQGRPVEVVSAALRDLEEEFGDRILVRGAGTTGSGRELIGELIGADTVNDEITCHKTGATFVGQRMLEGRVPDTIFEIGGQDSKYISLQDGVVVDFTMNEACAAGTGSFLEERAEELGISIINEFAELAFSSRSPIRLGERCTVFMERDVNDYLQRGAQKSDLVAGLAYSVVTNYINRVVRGRKIGQTIFFQGGTAYNDAVAAAFSMVLGKEIIVPPYNGVIGAIGAALLARDKMLCQPALQPAGGQYVPMRSRSRFRGWRVDRIHYNLREFICRGCSNECIMQEFEVEGEKTYWGDKCSDRYRKRRLSPTRPVIEDLFALRETLLNDESACPATPADALTIGIPRTMFAMDFLPFWRAFWRHCGFNVVTSDPTNRKIVAAGTACAVAEPCFPVIVAHGHVAQLLEKGVDYVFIPNTVAAETAWMKNESYLCPWNQTLAFVLRRAPGFESQIEKFLAPRVVFRNGREAVYRALAKFCRTLGVEPAVVGKALDAAYAAQQDFCNRLLEAGRKALEELRRTGSPGIVIIGRPYNVHDTGVNLSTARKLRENYGVNCIPIDCLDTGRVDIRQINSNMYWDYGRKLLGAGRIVARQPNLHIIYITNFKCGPDSFVKHFIRRASGKPFLILQFDGHSNDAGMMTRCEAYLDSKGILRPWKKSSAAEEAPVST